VEDFYGRFASYVELVLATIRSSISRIIANALLNTLAINDRFPDHPPRGTTTVLNFSRPRRCCLRHTPARPPADEVSGGFYTPVGTRRNFFNWIIVGASAIIGFGLAIPLVGYVISPTLKRREQAWRPVGKVDDLPVGEPRDLTYAMTVKDGWRETKAIKAVWAIKHPDNTVTVYSPICPHLGCGFRWDSRDRKFKCPCHGSLYALNGEVLGGPAPRPLDVLPSKIENGQLYVVYKEFKSGLAKQVEL
jgi:menaquinol-cytochrome c reductase iron-sulfur subunit